MSVHDPAERRLRAQVAIQTRLAGASSAERLAMNEKARATYTRQLEHEVDPDGVLDPADLALRVASLRRAKLARSALRALRARRAKQAAAIADAELDALIEADAAGADAGDNPTTEGSAA